VSPLLWIAVLVVVFASTAGAVFVFLRVRVLWRALKSLGSAVDVTLGPLNASLEQLTANTEAFGSETPKLEAALARLRGSLARAAVLRAAVQDVQDAFGRLTAVYPRK
jgi:hypothetical protein